jgi:NADH-quinone oxidoreductase subunit E
MPRSALLPLLHLVQAQDGHISDDGISECAELLGLTKAEVNAVATFYTMYKREPLGRHLVSVCTNFSCKVRGATQVYERLQDKLGVGHNQTTADGLITLEHAECLGNCEGAPVVTVDYLNYECLTPDQAEELVDRLIAGEVPAPTRGIASSGIRDVGYRLAGLGPRRAGEPGHAPDHATAADGALPAVTSGPGMTPVWFDAELEPVFAPSGEPEREEARDEVADSGQRADQVEREGGPQAREFPTSPSSGDQAALQPDRGER